MSRYATRWCAGQWGKGLAIIALTIALTFDLQAKSETTEARPFDKKPRAKAIFAEATSDETYAADLRFWQKVQGTTDPTEYEAYLEAFPDGVFSSLARARIRLYRQDSLEELLEETTPAVRVEAPPPDPQKDIEINDIENDFIVKTDMYLRSGPSTSYKPIGTLTGGSKVFVIGKVRGRNWYKIRSPVGIIGFGYAPLLMEASKPVPPRKAPLAPAPRYRGDVNDLNSDVGETYRPPFR